MLSSPIYLDFIQFLPLLLLFDTFAFARKFTIRVSPSSGEIKNKMQTTVLKRALTNNKRLPFGWPLRSIIPSPPQGGLTYVRRVYGVQLKILLSADHKRVVSLFFASPQVVQRTTTTTDPIKGGKKQLNFWTISQWIRFIQSEAFARLPVIGCH